ncbi:hypothetical protein L202_05216 [Cryptococcus amylolentus CBS 6039]|uniref:Uncharacterized protein n=2 Tax=Cryptococcus amylolentus TaxID=104669 RepID=A0A1E3HJP1_9TREE|nr:hypothetical protein L202_05216 [Cryptococcus amylolentus CBS 6039]ODN76554.1 hypothetical protein L202_05216 [Cryptococcus amylolentus CBS 6039]ODO04542.1 hypothetical protein I350_05146 [Cryptococcus amylolentus CBS 6273]
MSILPLYYQDGNHSGGTVHHLVYPDENSEVFEMVRLQHCSTLSAVSSSEPVYVVEDPYRWHHRATAVSRLPPLRAQPGLTTLEPLAPVQHLVLLLLLQKQYLGPSRTMALSPGIFHFVKYDVYRSVTMSRDLLKGLDGDRKSRQRKLDCLKCVQELYIDSMDALWDLANLHSPQRSYMFKSCYSIMPNARTVHIHRRAIVAQYTLEKGKRADEPVPWSWLKEGVMRQLGESVEVRFYGEYDTDCTGQSVFARVTYALPGKLLRSQESAEELEERRLRRKDIRGKLCLRIILALVTIAFIAFWGDIIWIIRRKAQKDQDQ